MLLLTFLIFVFVIYPILTLLHELGHAVAVMRTGRRPTVIVGKTPAPFVRRFRRFELHFNPHLGLGWFHPRLWVQPPRIGTCLYDPIGLTVSELRSIYSGGPHASIVTGLFLVIVAWFAPAGSLVFWVLAASALVASLEGLANLIPGRREGPFPSDGASRARLRGFDADLVLASLDERGLVFLPKDQPDF